MFSLIPHTEKNINQSGLRLEDRPSQSPRVLIVDDEILVGWSLANTLKRFNIKSIVVESAERALEEFFSLQIDVVITDRWLPQMKGEELAEAIKKIKPHTPIILISALPIPFELINSRLIDHFVEKPFNFQEICSLILHCLNGSMPSNL